MINNTESKKLYKVQSGVTEYPIGFPFQCNSDGVPQLAITIGTTYLQLNYNCKLSEDNGTLILIPTEEEAETLTGPEDYSWMDKWVDAPLVITRDIPFVQESDYQVGRISPEQIEKDFDASVMRDQILLDKIGEHTTDVSEELAALHSYIDFVQQTHENDVAEIDVELAKKATKDELSVANASIDANADAILKTREDFASADQAIRDDMNAEDSRLQTQITAQATAITTNKNDIDELGDDVADIQAKIPESASGTNHLITKQQLLDEELDIRKDLNSGLSELQTQVTAQAAKIETKQDKLIAGDNIVIGSDGKTISATGAGGGAGLSFIVYDTLPETGESGIIYLVPKDSEAPDVYDEYVWITATSTFELIGSTQVDLTDYVTKENLSNYLPLSGGTLTGPLTIEPSEKAQQSSGFVTMLTFVAEQEGGRYKATKNISLTPLGELGFGNTPISGLGSIIPYNTVQNIGTSKLKWFTIYAKKLNNGADIAVPTEGGTLARLEDLENIDALPDQTGNAGKFLTTDGTTASWGNALVNRATRADGFSLNDSYDYFSGYCVIGINASISGSYSTVYGCSSKSSSYGVALGSYANSSSGIAIGYGSKNTNSSVSGITIGYKAQTTATGAIQLGGKEQTNSDPNTFKVGNENGNFEMMSADGTIPADRMSATAGTTGQVLTKTDAGMEWQEASGGTTITLKEYDE